MLTRCAKCLIPATRPDTAFVEGVCSACISYEKRKSIDWEARQDDLLKILKEHDYRCIVPSSGGKDSTWQVLKLLELGAKVTVVTATTCMLTDIGRANIDNLARYATTVEVSPNRKVRAKLNRLGLDLVGDISWPEHIAIHRVPFRAAIGLEIPLIFYGECPNEAYGGPLGSEETRVMTQRWVSEFGGFLGLRAQDVIGMDGITEADMADYTAPTDAELKAAGVTAYFLGQFYEWDSRGNARVARDHGFRSMLPSLANWWHEENQDNAMTGIHDFMGWLKYGYGRLAAQMSVDIRAGLITREGAMHIVRKRDGLFPLEYMGVRLDAVLDHIGIGRDEFVAICDRFTNHELFVEPRVEWGKKLTTKDCA